MTTPHIDTPCTCGNDTHEWNCARAIVARAQANTERLHRGARERYEHQLQLAREAEARKREAENV